MTPIERHKLVIQANAINKMPRFAVGATVWSVVNGNICNTTVQAVMFKHGAGWYYQFSTNGYTTLHTEDFVFGHLDELIDALTE